MFEIRQRAYVSRRSPRRIRSLANSGEQNHDSNFQRNPHPQTTFPAKSITRTPVSHSKVEGLGILSDDELLEAQAFAKWYEALHYCKLLTLGS
jgi:hypothetical protein